MTTSLTDLIIQTIADKANLLDSFVILYASLAGALHRIIGIEFGLLPVALPQLSLFFSCR